VWTRITAFVLWIDRSSFFFIEPGFMCGGSCQSVSIVHVGRQSSHWLALNLSIAAESKTSKQAKKCWSFGPPSSEIRFFRSSFSREGSTLDMSFTSQYLSTKFESDASPVLLSESDELEAVSKDSMDYLLEFSNFESDSF
jgi:hypothetical protein